MIQFILKQWFQIKVTWKQQKSHCVEMTNTQKNKTDQFLPKLSSTCSLALHACDFFLMLGIFGENSKNMDNWMIELGNSENFTAYFKESSISFQMLCTKCTYCQ